jgi:hypothetical protein
MVRESTVIALKNNPRRYNVLYGRKSINEDVGAFKILGRAVRNLGLNKHVPRTANALGEISDFLKLNAGKKAVDFKINNLDASRFNPFKLQADFKTLKINDDNHHYKLYKTKNNYHLWIPKESHFDNRHLRITAKNDTEFKAKLEFILNNPSAQAKLDYRVTNIPFGLRNIHIPGLPRHEIYFDEERLTGTHKINSFKPIGMDGDLEQFDSKLGSVDRKQITYYMPFVTFEGYSARENKPITIRDDVWLKAHETGQFILASMDANELLETVIAQTYSGQKITPNHAAQMRTKMKEDFVFNLYGFGTYNGKGRGQTLLPFGEFPVRWQFSNDPLTGGRFWENHAPSNQEIATIMYVPQADGSAKLRYDVDKKAFMTIIDRLKIKPSDRQYLLNYARKALGIKSAIRFIQDELSKIKLDDPVSSDDERKKNLEKWQDLSYVKDRIFNNAGDLRDSLRKGNNGFSAYVEAVGLENIPSLKKHKKFITEGIPEKQGFIKTATSGLGKITEDYPYFENFWGWQGREYFGKSLFNIFSHQIFNRKIPPIVADNAVVMLTEAIDRTGRRLKLFNEVYLRDTKLSSNFDTLLKRINRGDYATAGFVLEKQRERFAELFCGKKDFADTAVKRLALQGEGVMFEEDVFPTHQGKYLGDNNGLINGTNFSENNLLAGSDGMLHRVFWQKAESLAQRLLPTMIDIARFMKAHQAGILNEKTSSFSKNNYAEKINNIDKALKEVYKRPEMAELDTYIKAAAHEMTLQYFERNRSVLSDGPDEDLRILFKHARTEFINLLQVMTNVIAMVSYNPETRKN